MISCRLLAIQGKNECDQLWVTCDILSSLCRLYPREIKLCTFRLSISLIFLNKKRQGIFFIFTTNQSQTNLLILELVKSNTCGVMLFNWSIYLTFLSVNGQSTMNKRSAVMYPVHNVVRCWCIAKATNKYSSKQTNHRTNKTKQKRQSI